MREYGLDKATLTVGGVGGASNSASASSTEGSSVTTHATPNNPAKSMSGKSLYICTIMFGRPIMGPILFREPQARQLALPGAVLVTISARVLTALVFIYFCLSAFFQ